MAYYNGKKILDVVHISAPLSDDLASGEYFISSELTADGRLIIYLNSVGSGERNVAAQTEDGIITIQAIGEVA